MNRIICVAAFATGLFAIAWIGTGYVGTSPLALLVTALIGAAFLAGAIELARFQRDTAALARALASIPQPLPRLATWLASVPAALQNPVRLRIEGERVALPGPALTPYLVGLLVLLGMLGTFLGLVVTLGGAVTALESTTDLQTIRAALSAPVKGLGVAFGTSVAGVAASAMLGLMSALCRRERQQAAQRLDSLVATALRAFSPAQQREERFKVMQQQAELLPRVVDRLDAMMSQLTQHHAQLQERLLAGQERFHDGAGQAYATLAASVDKALGARLAEGVQRAGETLKPMVEATLDGVAREAAALQARVAGTVETQLDGLSARFDDSMARVSAGWLDAQACQARSNAEWVGQLHEALERHDAAFAQRSAALLASVGQGQASLHAALVDSATRMAEDASSRQMRSSEHVEARLEALAGRLDAALGRAAERWTDALGRHDEAGARQAERLHTTLEAFGETFAQHADALLVAVGERATALHSELAAADAARLAAQRDALASMAATLGQAWQQAGVDAAARQEQSARAFAEMAREFAGTARREAEHSIDEVSRLMRAAAEAPRAAAEAIAELQAALGASMARDNEMLAERSRIMETLAGLLSAIDHASTGQRQAIDALVAASGAQLEHAGQRFEAVVDGQSARMEALAGQLGGGAAEMASLGEAFGVAVQLFSESNDKAMTALARIEGALERSLARSDEQLAYYVAQAREIIDLSLSSQKDIVEDLQRLAGRQAALAAEA